MYHPFKVLNALAHVRTFIRRSLGEGGHTHTHTQHLVPAGSAYLSALQFALQFDPAYLSFSGFVQDAMLVDSNAYSFQEEADGVVKLQ